MKKRMLSTLASAAGAFLAGCNALVFVPAEVACPAPAITLRHTEQLKARAGRTSCAFPTELIFTVAHAPRTAAAVAQEETLPGSEAPAGASELSLAGSRVTITQGSGAVFLCPGAGCTPERPQIEVAIDRSGSLTYGLLIDLGAAGLLPGPGGSASHRGVAAVESYGPGNACDVLADIQMDCAEAQ